MVWWRGRGGGGILAKESETCVRGGGSNVDGVRRSGMAAEMKERGCCQQQMTLSSLLSQEDIKICDIAVAVLLLLMYYYIVLFHFRTRSILATDDDI